MGKGRVAVLRVQPESVLESIERLCGLAEMTRALDATAPTILKDNISWHFPFPAANTTPWQLEGNDPRPARRGLCGAVLRPEQDGRHGRVQGRGPQPLPADPLPLRRTRALQLPRLGHEVGRAQPKARMHVLADIYPEGIRVPDYFYGKNIVPSADREGHIYTTTTGAMKNAFGGCSTTIGTTRTRGSTGRSSTCSRSRRRSTRDSSR
jgi:hypothetical protein